MLLKSLLLRNTLHIFEIECKVIKKKLNYQTFPIIFYNILHLSRENWKKSTYFLLFVRLNNNFKTFTPIIHTMEQPPSLLAFSS